MAACLGSWQQRWVSNLNDSGSSISAAMGRGDDGSQFGSWQRQWLVNLSGDRSQLTMGLGVGHFFFLFFFLWFVGSMIKCGHGWWSPDWEAPLASLLF